MDLRRPPLLRAALPPGGAPRFGISSTCHTHALPAPTFRRLVPSAPRSVGTLRRTPPQPTTHKRAAPFHSARDDNPAEAAAVEANFRVALRLGVIDSLSRSPTDASRWHSRPSAEERAQIARLLLAHQARVAVANAPSYQSTLANALDWLARFSATTPSLELFVRNLHQADSEYNAFTFALLFEFIRETGSKQAGSRFGKQLKASSFAAINSTLNARFSCFAGAPLYNPGANAALRRAAKQALRMGGATDLYDIYGPAGERLIRERGRWSSDVAQIYSRVSAEAHGLLSRSIGDSNGVNLQSLLAGRSQSTATHSRCSF